MHTKHTCKFSMQETMLSMHKRMFNMHSPENHILSMSKAEREFLSQYPSDVARGVRFYNWLVIDCDLEQYPAVFRRHLAGGNGNRVQQIRGLLELFEEKFSPSTEYDALTQRKFNDHIKAVYGEWCTQNFFWIL